MRIIALLFVAMTLSSAGLPQDSLDLDKILDEEMEKKHTGPELVEATFKTSRIINGHSIENTAKGILDLRISHRFGTLNNGFYQLFGLDNATMRMGLDYGISDRLTVGWGRSTYQKQYDAFFKYRILRQSTGTGNMPLSVSAVATAMLATDTTSVRANYNIPAGVKIHFSDKLSYAYQLIIARKFSTAFSLQLMPTMIHSNVVPLSTDPNDLFSVGIGGRLKITQRLSINAEYYYNIPGHRLESMGGSKLYNPLSVGFDIETGGHVFQLHFTNSRGMTERQFITETPGSWGKGDIHFGFNISRVFQIGKRRN
ncbi:MAG TPA: DUF5777 family beta-barrel protein [Chitinophagaceae bacterium]